MSSAPNPDRATQVAAIPAAAGASIATPTSISRAPTLSPSPRPFSWADCIVSEGSAASQVPDSLLDLEEGELAGTPPRCLPPPPRGPPPVGQPRRICSRVGLVRGDLLVPTGLGSSIPAADAAGFEEGAEDPERPWQIVQRRRSREAAAPPPIGAARPRPRPQIPPHLRGLCFKCLKKGHFIAVCRDPICCRRCSRSGHLERECPEARPDSQACPAAHARPAPQARPAPRARPDAHGRSTPVRLLRSFVEPPMVSCTKANGVRLASLRCYKEGVDGTLSEENERASRIMLFVLGEGGDSAALAQASCDGGHASTDVEVKAADGLMQQLVPCFAELGGEVVPLDDEEMELEEASNADLGVGSALLSHQGGLDSSTVVTEIVGPMSPLLPAGGDAVVVSPPEIDVEMKEEGTEAWKVCVQDLVDELELRTLALLAKEIEDLVLSESAKPHAPVLVPQKEIIWEVPVLLAPAPVFVPQQETLVEVPIMLEHEVIAGPGPLISSAPTFAESLSVRITAPLLSAAPPMPDRRRPRNPVPVPTRQASDRRAVTSMAGLSTIERARRVLRKKWGLPAEDEMEGVYSEEVRQQRFMALFKDPKTALETEAVRALLGRVGPSRSVIPKTARRQATTTAAARAARAAA